MSMNYLTTKLSPPPEMKQNASLEYIDQAGASYLLHLSGLVCEDPHHAPLYELFCQLFLNTRRGDLCLDLNLIREAWNKSGSKLDNGLKKVSVIDHLSQLHVVGNSQDTTPLVLENNRLYLRKHFAFEANIIQRIDRFTSHRLEPSTLPEQDLLEQLFPASIPGDRKTTGSGHSDQRLAAANALFCRFMIVTGGPGTGKTTTVLGLLALLLSTNPDTRIALVAPTGKAANRLQQSIQRSISRLEVADEIKSRIPDSVGTIHRLLGPSTGSSRFQFNQNHTLPYDCIIVDEASMVDAALFSRLLEATAPDSRLILVGDRNQLASVESGAVLGDLCDAAGYSESGGLQLSSERVELLKKHFASALEHELSPTRLQKESLEDESRAHTAGRSTLRDSVVGLQQNYRFGSRSGIALLAEAVREGKASHALQILADPDYPDVQHAQPDESEQRLESSILSGYTPLLLAEDPARALAQLENYCVLSPHRHGPMGSIALAQYISRLCLRRGLLSWSSPSGFSHLTPVMVTRNDYLLSLFNGDTGVIWNGNSAIFATHEAENGRAVSLDMLVGVESAFSMTVHKSQGSEYDRVDLVLPDQKSELLSRELLYTAITRARKDFTVYGPKNILKYMIEQRVNRVSGLGHGFEE